jgi:Domain of unknown function (DUF4365)
VIVVLYDPETQTAYWQVVTPETVESTGKGWKLAVPRENVLDAAAGARLVDIAGGDPYVLALNELRSERTWMALLRDGGELVIEVEEWVNKTSGRGEIAVHGTSPTGETSTATWAVFFGVAPYEVILPELFPWATLDVDDEVYDQNEENEWMAEAGYYDKEEGRVIVVGESFEDWRSANARTGLRPYVVEQSELARWRLRLTLNELGHSFLRVDDHLSEQLG